MLYFLGGLLLLVAVLAYVVMHHVLPHTIITPRRVRNTSSPADYGMAFEAAELIGEDGIKLDALFLPAPGPARANLIILHGIGSCKEVYFPILPPLLDVGYNLLLWDQRAHGKSGGRHTTFGAKEKLDVSRGLDWLAAKTGTLPTSIYGNSMGGAVALQSLATDKRLQFGLIESTFTDLPTITHAYGHRLSGYALPRWLTDHVLKRAGQIAGFAPFEIRPVDAAVDITQPIQLIHGDADGNINISHAHLLFSSLASADKAFHVVPGGDHADLWERGERAYRDVFYGFLERMVAAR